MKKNEQNDAAKRSKKAGEAVRYSSREENGQTVVYTETALPVKVKRKTGWLIVAIIQTLIMLPCLAVAVIFMLTTINGDIATVGNSLIVCLGLGLIPIALTVLFYRLYARSGR